MPRSRRHHNNNLLSSLPFHDRVRRKTEDNMKQEKQAGIYAIVAEGGRQYIGSSADIAARFRRHKTLLNTGVHFNSKLQRHVNKYGFHSISFKVLECCDVSELLKREQHYMDCLSPYFNLSPTAGSITGLKRQPFSEEHRRKLSLRKIGTTRVFSEAHRFNLSESKRGEKNALSKLKPSQRGEIADLRKAGVKWKEIALRYGVCEKSAQNILRGVTYA